MDRLAPNPGALPEATSIFRLVLIVFVQERHGKDGRSYDVITPRDPKTGNPEHKIYFNIGVVMAHEAKEFRF